MAARARQRERRLRRRASSRARPGLTAPYIAVDVSCRPPPTRRIHLTPLLPSLHEKPGRTVEITHALEMAVAGYEGPTRGALLGRDDDGGEMAAPGEDMELGVGNGAGQLLRVEARGEHVVGGDHDQRRRGDLAQTRAAVEAHDGVDPAREDLHGRRGGDPRSVLRLQGGVIGAHPPARSEEGHRGPEIALHARLQEDLLADLEAATEEGILPRPRRGQDEARDPLRLILREHLPDGASRGVAGEMRARDAEAIHEGEDVGGHLLDGILDAPVAAAAGAAVIMNDNAKVAGEGLDLGGPERAEAGEAGHEEERGALAALLVVEVAVAQGRRWARRVSARCRSCPAPARW